jgi:PPOX class probable F420-dependent enzyme
MATIPQSVRALVESGKLAHFVTRNADGSPQLTVVWVGLDGDEFVTAHLNRHQKVKNVQRDAHVVFSMEADTTSPIGLKEYLVVYGTAVVEEGGAPELLQRLAHVYLGRSVIFPPMPNPPAGYVMRITPERYGGVGPWAHGG